MTTDTDPATTSGWIPNDEAFGTKLAMLRQSMGWGNIKEAAHACGLPAESWRTWERDNVHPRRVLEVAAAIAQATGCDYAWLVGARSGQRLTYGANGAISARYRRVDQQRVSDRPNGRRKDRPPNRPAGSRRESDPATRRPVVLLTTAGE